MNSSSKKAKIQTILFDMDGTLIDTELAASQTVSESFREWKIQITPEDIAYVTGRTWESTFDHLFSKYKIPIPQSEARVQLMDRYRDHLETKLSVVPGSVEAVATLATHYPLALVSGSRRTEILWALKKLKIEQHFQVILGAEDYTRSKPHPDGYLKAIDLLRAEPQSCLVFEDSSAGIQSARSAGLWVAAITSTNHFQQDQSQAHVKIVDLTQVSVQWIQDLSFD